MKGFFSVVLFVITLAMCAPAFAETAKNAGPEVINLKMGVMVLPFKHHEHQKTNECFLCHASKNGKIDGWGKDTAHKICIACHELEDKGPTQCRECHKK